MAEFKYTGDHTSMSVYGLTFREDGENVKAETDDPFICGKLRGNSHFEEIGVAPAAPAADDQAPVFPTNLNECTREQLRERGALMFGADIPLGPKAGMIEALRALEVSSS